MKKSLLKWSLAVPAVALVIVLLVRPWQTRALENASAAEAGREPVVAVSLVRRENLFKSLSIPAEFRPYAEVELHAKVSGYVQRMNVDIGDKVKTGELLALLEVPELNDELDHAVAAQQRAAADYRDTHLAYTRLVAVNKEHPNLVAQQDLDSAEAKDATAAGALAAAKAEQEKYRTLVGYTRITAPFGGVITKRYADPGALIQAGTASQTQSMPLVRLSDNSVLRLDFPISVDYVSVVKVNAPISVRVDSLGGREFSGKITRYANHVDDATRTMVVETEIPNPTLQLVPGMYATVRLKMDEHPDVLAIPIEAVPAGSRTVWVVNADRSVTQREVALGLETPGRREVLSGLKEGDQVVIGNAVQLSPGEKVQPHVAAPLGGAEG